MLLESIIFDWIRPEMQPELNKKNNKYYYLKLFLSVIILFIALVVSWDCNLEVEGVYKVLNLIVAGMFSSVYLVFYMFYRIILNNPCY
jgi:hypothetical protein